MAHNLRTWQAGRKGVAKTVNCVIWLTELGQGFQRIFVAKRFGAGLCELSAVSHQPSGKPLAAKGAKKTEVAVFNNISAPERPIEPVFLTAEG